MLTFINSRYCRGFHRVAWLGLGPWGSDAGINLGLDRGGLMCDAERQRRYRERQRAGEIVVGVTLKPEAVDALHRAGLLKLHEVEDRSAIAQAIAAALGLIGVALRGDGEASDTLAMSHIPAAPDVP